MDVFSRRFKELKLEKGVTYQNIADQLGLKMRAVQLYASGSYKPAYAGLMILADYFGVSLDYLTGRVDERYGGYKPPNIK